MTSILKAVREATSFVAEVASSLLQALFAYPRYLVVDTIEYMVTVRRYYPNLRFRRADLHCLWAYLLRNPDNICHRYLRSFPDDQVQKIYGESFFTTLEAIAKAVDLSEHDVIYDLGCGRGRSVFWFNALYRCRAVGVEINPTFVIQARKIQKKQGIDDVEFIFANLMDVDYSDATVLYLYGTAFNDAAIATLVERFATLRRGTRIVSVSYPLTKYTKTPLFELVQTMPAKYPWGSTHIYIHRKL